MVESEEFGVDEGASLSMLLGVRSADDLVVGDNNDSLLAAGNPECRILHLLLTVRFDIALERGDR